MDKNLINKIKNEKINYIVEWWEEDSLDIDSNQHILFSLENEDIDIIITEKNIDEINFVLEKFNVNISMEFHVNFLSLKPLLFAIILSSFLFQPGTHPTGTYLYIIIPFHRKAMFSGKFSPPIRRVRIISPNQIFLPAENQWSSNTCPQRPPGSSPSVPAYISFSSALPLTHSVPHRTHSNRHPGSQGVPCLPQCSGVPHRNRSC